MYTKNKLTYEYVWVYKLKVKFRLLSNQKDTYKLYNRIIYYVKITGKKEKYMNFSIVMHQ